MRFAVVMALVLAMSWVSTAHAAGGPDGANAKGDKNAARAEWRQGNVAYNLGHYDDAAKHYEAAYTLVQDPAFLFNIAQSYRMGGKLDQALDRYRAFLRTASADAPNRDTAGKFVQEIKHKLEEKKEAAPIAPPGAGTAKEPAPAFEKSLVGAHYSSPETVADGHRSVAQARNGQGRIRIDCDMAGAEVTIDGKSVGLTPLPEPFWVAPGRHQVTASHASAFPTIETVDVESGSVAIVIMRMRPLAVPAAAASLPAPPSSQSPPGANQGWWLGRRWTWIAAGFAVLLAGGAIAFDLAMYSKIESSKSYPCGPDKYCYSTSDSNSINSRMLAAEVLGGLAAAAAVTTVVLFFVEGRPVSVAPVVGGMTGALVRVGF
jgi:hypothetical protein